ERGVLEDETFSADSVTITFSGVSAHPGYAKGKMVNAIKVASAFLSSLPREGLSPETTAGREGFVHPVYINGMAEKVSVEFILRDFITANLQEYAALLQQRIDETLTQFAGATATLEIKEQYRNMKEILNAHPKVSAYAIEAIQRAGMEPVRSSARGGTDGSRLSFMGLPCPNLFTGEMAFHGRHEYVSVQDMQKSVETIVHLAMIWEEKG
ncbi:MAG TPA: M20/M25/M40 family metallo-hydrolase, partial [Agriterribacter sp.]|nr:M20/M25/M40 family metallo-hydrolase [Agriterribacter sp.]